MYIHCTTWWVTDRQHTLWRDFRPQPGLQHQLAPLHTFSFTILHAHFFAGGSQNESHGSNSTVTFPNFTQTQYDILAEEYGMTEVREDTADYNFGPDGMETFEGLFPLKFYYLFLLSICLLKGKDK